MKTGVYYLYEYKNNQKFRNVGFLKFSREFDSCYLQLCARGLSVFQNDAAVLSALFCLDEEFCSLSVGSVICENHAITCRLEIPNHSLTGPQPLWQLVGFLLELPNGIHIAATEGNTCFTPSQLTTVACPSISAQDHTSDLEPKSEPECTSMPESMSRFEQVPEPAYEHVEIKTNIQKISRNELCILPRKCWHLANNSFLLHGYYNYNHLLLVEEDGHFLLGVPGIYDKQEARAAELFGFPSFSDSYVNQLQLSQDEIHPHSTFGHWCRKIPKGKDK